MSFEVVSAALCGCCCFTFISFVLQTVGFFSPMWASNSTCDSIGLIYSCCAGANNMTCKNTNAGNELDARALGLEATSFSIMFLAVFSICCGGCCSKEEEDDDHDWCAALAGCCIMLFPVAGLFSVIGCIIVATKFSTSDLGYSFALCLTAGVLILITTILLCILVKFYNDNDDDDKSTIPPRGISRSTVSPLPQQTAVQPYYGGAVPAIDEPRTQQVEYEIHHATHHQAVAVQDQETGGILFFIRKISFTRLVAKVKGEE